MSDIKNISLLRKLYNEAHNREIFIMNARDNNCTLQSIANFIGRETGTKPMSRERIRQIDEKIRDRIELGHDVRIPPSKRADYDDGIFLRSIKLTKRMKKLTVLVDIFQEVDVKDAYFKEIFIRDNIKERVIEGLEKRELISYKDGIITLTEKGSRAAQCLRGKSGL